MTDALIIIPEITKGMKSIGSKALLKSNNLSLIEYQINQIKNINKSICISIITGFDHDRILKLLTYKYDNLNIIYNDQYEHTNQADHLLLFLEKKLNVKKLLIINGGVLFKNFTILYENLTGSSKIYLLDKPKNNFTIGCDTGDTLEYLFYDLPVLWSECLFLNEDSIKLLHDIITSISIKQMYLFEIVNQLINKDTIFDKVYIKKQDILKINSIKDLPKMKNFT
jgi:hypothetical protein